MRFLNFHWKARFDKRERGEQKEIDKEEIERLLTQVAEEFEESKSKPWRLSSCNQLGSWGPTLAWPESTGTLCKVSHSQGTYLQNDEDHSCNKLQISYFRSPRGDHFSPAPYLYITYSHWFRSPVIEGGGHTERISGSGVRGQCTQKNEWQEKTLKWA